MKGLKIYLMVFLLAINAYGNAEGSKTSDSLKNDAQLTVLSAIHGWWNDSTETPLQAIETLKRITFGGTYSNPLAMINGESIWPDLQAVNNNFTSM